jgi:hypothetical protein
LIRAAILLLLAPLAAHAQLQLFVGPANVTNATYSLGPVAAGSTGDVVIEASNTGNAPITIAQLVLGGSGFNLIDTSATPYTVAPGSSMRIEVRFSAAGGPLGSYSAALEVGTVGVILIATSVAAATLTAASPCTGPDSSNTINFGSIIEGQTATCPFVLQNNSSQQITVSIVSVTGSGFLIPQPPATPLNLPPGISANFTIVFEPPSAAVYSGTLAVGSQMFTLTGTGYNPPLPAPMLQFDTSTPQSGQQVTLTMTLPAPAPVAASGSVNLAFQPDASVAALAADDPTVVFVVNGARSVPFSIAPGSAQATFAGQTGAVFQTGTTTGKITFTVAVASGPQPSAEPTASITLAPVPVGIDNAAATAIAGALNIQVWGFDNTYSAGAMSFTFYDNSAPTQQYPFGKPIGSGPITADFTSQFRTYFNTSTDGSAFSMLVSFPITGNAAEVGSVNVQMTNSAGTTTISQLVFLNDTGTCVLSGNVLSCPPAPTQ